MEVPGLNLGSESGYLIEIFIVFLSSCMRIPDITLKLSLNSSLSNPF
jgi:hypothetical protein